ncbi:Hypothetical predicted protein [Mytilus galloprovincialis]|uniref:Endonuclease/exonuclease/phosphatase domain-containing protein n=1 Tax=Mytilus galloprovincialis TaxID=29158 RepID=A0A8B6H9U2_MYTGA|nr:Hypothetical predicted protein [Mytilus galloprovincialis]
MTENYLICVNDGQYTRRNSQSVIDLAIISENIYNEVKDCITLTHESVKSDHIAVYLDVKSEEKIEDNQTTEEIWNLKKIDWNKWKNTTKQIFSSFEYVNREKTDDLYRRFEIEFEKYCDGKVLFNEQLKCEELEKTYFKGNHLKTSSFDQTHYEEIMKKYKNISEEMFDQEMEEKEYNEPIDPDELIGAIQRLKNDTAPGPDQIFQNY